MNARYLLAAALALTLQAGVFAQAPSWTVNPGSYQYTSSMVAHLYVDGVLRTDNSTVAFFVGTQVRGVGQPIPGTGGLYFLSIYSNTVTGEALTLKTYLPVENAVVDITETFTFTANQFWGAPADPVQLHAWSDGDIPVSLDPVPDLWAIRPAVFPVTGLAGYIVPGDGDPVEWSAVPGNHLVASLNGDQLATSPADPNWTGTDSVAVTVTEVTPNEYADTRHVRYHVIPGYRQPDWDSIPSQAIDMTQVFAQFDLDDFVQASYEGDCLDYSYRLDMGFADSSHVLPNWTVNPSSFNYSMTVTGQAVMTPSYVFNNPGDRLAAFSGNTVVGVGQPVQVGGSSYYFLTVFSNNLDSVSFRFYSAEKQRLFDLPAKLKFQPAANVGSIASPYRFDASPLGVGIGPGNLVTVSRRDPNWVGLLTFHFAVAECAYPALSNDTIAANFSVGLVEICDGIDNDGDTHVDEGLRSFYYTDTDGDGFGAGAAFLACPGDPTLSLLGTDCDDTSDAVFPGATETCNGIDDNCDSEVDEGLRYYFYLDADNDGFGTGDPFLACVGDPNISLVDTDCDDANDAVFPGATETCNSVDDDCDLLVDSEDPGIVDPTPPTALCRAATVYLGNNGAAPALTTAMVDNGSSDACGIASLSLSQTAFGCANTGTNAVVLTVTDNNGLASTCTATVTVLDTLKPTVVCKNITLQFTGTSVAFQPASIFDAIASSDNCGSVVPMNVTPTTSFSCSQAGDFPVTLHAADQSGNTATCQATVTVLPFVTLDTIIQTPPDCLSSNGGFEVVASVPLGQLGFSMTGGISWQFSGLFEDLAAGLHTVTMQVFGYPGCAVPPLTVALSEASGPTWYLDGDDDGYSDGTSILACSQPAGWYSAGSLDATSGDCNDANPGINPGATETCNGVDDDCSGAAESATNNWTGNGNGTLWSDPANWSDGNVPLPCQNVTVPTGSSVLVPAGFQAFAKTLTVVLGADLSVALTGTVTVLP